MGEEEILNITIVNKMILDLYGPSGNNGFISQFYELKRLVDSIVNNTNNSSSTTS